MPISPHDPKIFGYTLYQAYIEALAKRNVITDSWESLPEDDKDDWELAASIFIETIDLH